MGRCGIDSRSNSVTIGFNCQWSCEHVEMLGKFLIPHCSSLPSNDEWNEKELCDSVCMVCCIVDLKFVREKRLHKRLQYMQDLVVVKSKESYLFLYAHTAFHRTQQKCLLHVGFSF